jgi:hypothetical protein
MKPFIVVHCRWIELADRTLVRSASETHRRAMELMGFAKSSTHPTAAPTQT